MCFCGFFDSCAAVETASKPIYAKNITPAAIGNWTDGELYRLITAGVNKNNEALFPLMPYLSYSIMDPDDVQSIICYIRTLKPVSNNVPESKLNFPLNYIVRTMPKDPAPMKRPPESDRVNYGHYLARLAGCSDCHTPMAKGEPIPGKEFAGGNEFVISNYGTVRSANITPNKNTGIGNWTEDFFVERFKYYDNPEKKYIKINPGELQTYMPWTLFAGMKENDLRAIYSYLKTLKAVDNRVIKFTPHREITMK